MNDLSAILDLFLKENSAFPKIRRVLNFLFTVGITSFIYEKIYGGYSWFDFKDYPKILDYLVKGYFFIPFSIFVIVYSITELLAFVIFFAFGELKNYKLKRKIEDYEIKRENRSTRPKSATLVIQLYEKIREITKSDQLTAIKKKLNQLEQNIELNFYLTIRMFLATVVYFATVPQFGWILFVSILIIIVSSMVFLIICHRVIDILPTLAKKIYGEMQVYLKSLETMEAEEEMN